MCMCAQLPGLDRAHLLGGLHAHPAGHTARPRSYNRDNRVSVQPGQHHIPHGRRGRTAIGASQVDPLLRERDLDTLHRRALRVRPGARRV